MEDCWQWYYHLIFMILFALFSVFFVWQVYVEWEIQRRALPPTPLISRVWHAGIVPTALCSFLHHLLALIYFADSEGAVVRLSELLALFGEGDMGNLLLIPMALFYQVCLASSICQSRDSSSFFLLSSR